MLYKKTRNRLLIFLTLSIIITAAFFLVINLLTNSLLYFKSPSQILNDDFDTNKKLRLGGLVKKNSIQVIKDEIQFLVIDERNEILVSFKGSVPNLFSEGKGVVAEGKLVDKKIFFADKIMAKHDENYKPPDNK
tara:strand:+ start:754 stop:1155 length:402 start_codon:yes stop_codon:yes gene_type:complete